MTESAHSVDDMGTGQVNVPIEDSHTKGARLCRKCYGEEVPIGRWMLGYRLCLTCGEKIARAVKHAIVPLPKSNYIYAHTKEDVLSPYSHKGNR